MSLIANAISEELVDVGESAAAHKGKGKKVSEKNKVIAACTGAVITSLTSESSLFRELMGAILRGLHRVNLSALGEKIGWGHKPSRSSNSGGRSASSVLAQPEMLVQSVRGRWCRRMTSRRRQLREREGTTQDCCLPSTES